MHISCEQCGTTYVLDERLIPPQGAPVQCTKCQHVFTALPPQATRPAPAASQTVIFGAGQAAPPAPPPSRSAAPANQTQMFGAASTPPSAKPAGNQTQMFGAGGSPAVPPGRASNQTQMFGAVPPQPGPGGPKPAENKTVLFGPTPSESSAPNPRSTQVFGAVSPQPPNPAGRPGNIEFAKPAQPAPARSTMIFGAAGAKPGLSEATVRVGPADLERMLKEHREARGGDVTPSEGVPEAPVEPQRHAATQMFAMADVAPQPRTPDQGSPPVPQRHDRTQLFAYADGVAPEVAAEPAAEEAPKRHDRTQLFPYTDAEKTEQGEPARHAKTQLFASSSAEPPAAAQQRHNKTQLFAYADGEPTPGGQVPPVTEPLEPVEPRSSGRLAAPKATMIFGPTEESTDPVGKPASGRAAPVVKDLATDPSGVEVVNEAPRRKDPSLNVTSPHLPDLGPQLDDLGQMSGDPGLMATDFRQGDDAQPETMDGEAAIPPPSAPEVAARQIQAAGRRRTVVALMLVVLVVLGLVLAAAWKLWGERLLAPKVPPEAVQVLDTELLRLRGDETEAKDSVIKALSTLVAAHPAYVEAHAGLVTAYVLRLDDLQQQQKRLELMIRDRNERIVRFNTDKIPADWEKRANDLNQEAQKIKAQMDALASQAKKVEDELRAAYARFGVAAQNAGHATPEAQRAALRAQALFQAYGASDKVFQMIKDFKAVGPGGAADGWMDLVLAEYVVNVNKVTEATVSDALKQLDALHARDGSFLRTYTLAARIHLKQGDLDEAEVQLDKLLALKPKHDVAITLKAAVATARAEKVARDREREDKQKAAHP